MLFRARLELSDKLVDLHSCSRFGCGFARPRVITTRARIKGMEPEDGRARLDSAWRCLTQEQRAALSSADDLVAHVALQTAAAVALTLRKEDLSARALCAKKAEKDVLEQAAKELQLLVLHTSGIPYSLDGQIPLTIESGCGLIGIEVKSGATSIGTDEVDKFRSDLALGPFVVGVFFSLRAAIAKLPRGLHVQSELSLKGSVPAIYVSAAPSEAVSQHLTRSALSLACFLARQRPQRFCGDSAAARESSICADRELVLEELHRSVQAEVAALGIARKRLREDEDAFQKRVDRASDSIMAVQHRLASVVSNMTFQLR